MDNETLAGMYLHIPFCISKCKYCSFVSVPVKGSRDARIKSYVPMLVREMEDGHSAWSDQRFDSLFIGGGTPSVLPLPHIARLIEKAFELYRFENDREVTVEANPESFTPQKAYDYHMAGVNRLSFGVQSVREEELRMLGRAHSWPDAQNAIDYARMAGICNINVDLIYNLPGQRTEDFLHNARHVLDLGIEHLSCYALTLEEGTHLYENIRNGHLPTPDEDEAADMFMNLEDLVKEYGLRRYEISNYAKEGFESRHNLHYWQQDNYAGFGVAAHSAKRRNGSVIRTGNGEDLDSYLKNGPTKQVDEVSGQEALFEYIMLTTRLADGLQLSDFQNRFGIRFEDVYKEAITQALQLGLAELTPSRFFFNSRGLLLQNSLLQLFMLP